jgi:hypothetical protein
MDEAFACPDCGTIVEIKGLAPGRQVRCDFCRRLLEVPYLPRVAELGWKRRRFGRPWWVVWAWTALGLLGVLIVVIAAVRFLDRRERTALARSIDRLIASSRTQEKAGRRDQAVVDLDSAINLCPPDSAEHRELLLRFRSRRQALVRLGAQDVLERLRQNENRLFPLGDWLNLQARVTTDPDLAPLQGEVAAKLQTKLKQCIESDLAAARNAAELGKALMAFDRCETLAPLAAHLPEPDRGRLRGEAGEIVLRIIDRHGVLLDPPHGHFLTGSMARYNANMIPTLVKALKAKGYLPQPDVSPWRDRWSRSPYRFSLEVNERAEGNYLASENRLTRIDTHLKLFYRGMEIWQTTPTARTKVPLPGLPGYFSARVALSPARIEEFERLLYDDARSQIDEKFAFALSHMPECGPSAPPGQF